MRFGVFLFPAPYTMHPAEFAREVESRGFEAVLFTDHTHIPASRQTPWPGGGELPREYYDNFELFTAIGAALTATSTLQVGSGICLVIERDPIITAKQVASLDALSGGRVLFGVGGGWNAEEMAHHGTEFSSRFRLLRERIEAMKAIWSEDEATYRGQFVNFTRIWSWPKPHQKPHPPILVGGNAEQTLQRVVRYGDEWLPNLRRESELAPRITQLQALAQAAGRQPIPVSSFGLPNTAAAIASLEAQGVYRGFFHVPSEDRDAVLRRLDSCAQLMREVQG